MAPFNLSDDSDRLDWYLLQNGPAVLYFSRSVLAEHAAWLRRHHYGVHQFDCSADDTEDDLHREIGKALGFHGYKRSHLDAFNDFLSQLEIPQEGGLALVFAGFDAVWRKSPDRLWTMLDIIADNARRFLLTGMRLLTLVQSDDEGIGTKLKPVGATRIGLNMVEFGRNVRFPRGMIPPALDEEAPPAV